MPKEWNKEDTAWLRNLLSQPSGQKLVSEIRGLIPKVKAVTKESAWIQAVQKQGAEDLLQGFLALAEFAESELVEGRDFVDLTKEGD